MAIYIAKLLKERTVNGYRHQSQMVAHLLRLVKFTNVLIPVPLEVAAFHDITMNKGVLRVESQFRGTVHFK